MDILDNVAALDSDFFPCIVFFLCSLVAWTNSAEFVSLQCAAAATSACFFCFSFWFLNPPFERLSSCVNNWSEIVLKRSGPLRLPYCCWWSYASIRGIHSKSRQRYKADPAFLFCWSLSGLFWVRPGSALQPRACSGLACVQCGLAHARSLPDHAGREENWWVGPYSSFPLSRPPSLSPFPLLLPLFLPLVLLFFFFF